MTGRRWLPGLLLGCAVACAGGKEERRASDGGEAAERDGAGDGERREAPDEPAEKGVPPSGATPRVPAAPEGLLAPGAIGRIQAALEARGYLAEAHRSGELDAPTSAGIRKFQEDEGLAATGMPDRETLDRLGLDPNAAYGREEEGRR